MNSMRTGSASPGGNTSTMPPRTQNSPCSSTGSSRVKPASTSCSASSCGPISTPEVRSDRRRSQLCGRHQSWQQRAAEITTTRAWPARPRRAHGSGWRRPAGEAPSRDTDRLHAMAARRRHRQPPIRRIPRAHPEIADVRRELIDVSVGRHDDDDQVLRGAIGAQGDVQASRRRCEAGNDAAVEIQTGFRRGRTEQRPKCKRAGG